MKAISVTAFLTTSLLLANAANVGFDNYVSPQDNDLATYFRVMYPYSPLVLSQTPSGGIVGGGLQFSDSRNYAEAVYMPASFRNDAGDTYRVSGFFRPSTDPVAQVFLGFSSNPDAMQLADGYGRADGGSLAMYCVPGALYLTTSSFGSGYASFAVPLSLSENNWYRLSLSVSRNLASNDFTLNGTVEDYGPSGTSSPVLLASADLTRPSEAMQSASTVWAGLAGMGARSGYSTTRFDDFQAMGIEVVPEPTTLGLATLGVAATAFVRVRRKKA